MNPNAPNFNPTFQPMPGHAEFQAAIEAAVRKHNIAINELTEAQVCEAFKQAIACGDFMMHVVVRDGGQCVTYMPYQREQELEFRIKALEDRRAELVAKWRQLEAQASYQYDDSLADGYRQCREELEGEK